MPQEEKPEKGSVGAYFGWPGAAVVILALGALVGSLALILHGYDVGTTVPATGTGSETEPATVSASSVVTILTPVVAGIVGIAGLFFGIAAKGRNAEVEQKIAATNAKTVSDSVEVAKEGAVAATAALASQEGPGGDPGVGGGGGVGGPRP
jgi:hypothetical protein